MNVLFIIITPGEDEKSNTVALVPIAKLQDVDLELINDKMVNGEEDLPDAVSEQIVNLYKRLGLESQRFPSATYNEKGDVPQPRVPVDLAQYVNPQPPFQVDRVIRFGWAV